MLVEFRVENHRSIQEEQALTLGAASIGDLDDPRPRHVAGSPDPLLTVAAIYGANASGKSNVLSALAFMRRAVLDSHRLWAPDGGVPREPYAWAAGLNAHSLFEVTFIVDGVRYQYGFACDGARVLEEWLRAWPKGRVQTWFERDGDSFQFGVKLKGQNRDIQHLTRPNSLFLSAAIQNQHVQLQPIYQWFRELIVRGVGERRPRVGGSRSLGALLSMLEQAALEQAAPQRGQPSQSQSPAPEPRPVGVQQLIELLQAADVGILDIKLRPNADDARLGRSRPPSDASVLLRHQHTGGDAWLPLSQESQGTRTLLSLAPSVLLALSRGSTIAIDELEASFHPLLALKLVEIFNAPERNPRNAQLIFTTHDTNLLGTLTGPAPLRRDQVWLTEKDGDGRTHLYPLTDYKPRKAENLERGYLQGRYGAVPFLGELTPELPSS